MTDRTQRLEKSGRAFSLSVLVPCYVVLFQHFGWPVIVIAAVLYLIEGAVYLWLVVRPASLTREPRDG